MNAILWPVFNYVAKNRWAQIVLGLGIFWLIFMAWLAVRDSGIRRVERERQKFETAKERERVIETSHQIIEDIEDAKDAAIAAPHSVPIVSSADELREQAPAIAEVILRNRR